jgi:hypothetical protein
LTGGFLGLLTVPDVSVTRGFVGFAVKLCFV